MNSTYVFLYTEDNSKTKPLLDKGCYERGCRDFMLAKKLTFRNYIAIFFTVTLLMPVVSSFAQTLTPKEWEAIQKSNNYLIGMGMNTNIDEARQTALSDLASKISTNVSSRFDYELINENKGMAVNSEARMKNVINSYSNVALKDVAEHVVKDKQGYVIYRYMKKSDMRAMFKRRIGLAKKWANEAIEQEKEGKIGDALQGFYWSLALLNSCPDADLETIGYDEVSMDQDLHRRVKEILKGITIKAISVEKEPDGQYLTLSVFYNGKPATNFNYKYFDGKQSSEVYTAKDGEGDLLIPSSANLRRLKIQAEYECRDEANIHPDVRSVMEFTDPVAFKAAELTVDTKNCEIIHKENFSVQELTAPVTACYETVSEQMVTPFLQTINSIEQGIANHKYQSLRDLFTDEGWKMFNGLIHYGNANLLKAPVVQFLPDKDGGVICRSFPMSFSFKGNRRTFTEDVVFYLNSDAKVTEVAFGLEKAAVDNIMNRGQWSQDERQTMIHFLETYKTAYALKRLDYISNIFSNEALIVTGWVVKGTGQTEMSPSKPSHIKYVRQTKDQYINSLRKCFASNEYVNIHFADNNIRRSATRPTIYGIQIKQDYFSSTYGDTGYLFLLIDFEKPELPVIHVRTWQPDLDPNVKDGRINITSFNL